MARTGKRLVILLCLAAAASCVDDSDPSTSGAEGQGTTSSDTGSSQDVTTTGPEGTSGTSAADTEGPATSSSGPPSEDGLTEDPVQLECDVLDTNTPCEDPPGRTHCVPFDPLGVGQWSGAWCIHEGDDEKGAGAPCTVPDGPILGQQGCAKGFACATESAEATQGICVRLCLYDSNCETGTCAVCTAEHFFEYGVCLAEIECTDQPACAVAGCWP